MLDHFFRRSNQLFDGVDENISLLSPVECLSGITKEVVENIGEVLGTFLDIFWNLLTRLHHCVDDDHVGDGSNSRLFALVKLFGVLFLQSTFRFRMNLLRVVVDGEVRFDIIDLGLDS